MDKNTRFTPVEIVLGSKKDRPIVDESEMLKILNELGIKWQISYISAHRNKDTLRTFCELALENDVRVIIAAAGMMPALSGDIAGWTLGAIPVISVVLDSPTIAGSETIATAVSMPRGVVTLSVGIGKPGLANAAIATAQILAIGDPDIRTRWLLYRSTTNPMPEIHIESSPTLGKK